MGSIFKILILFLVRKELSNFLFDKRVENTQLKKLINNSLIDLPGPSNISRYEILVSYWNLFNIINCNRSIFGYILFL